MNDYGKTKRRGSAHWQIHYQRQRKMRKVNDSFYAPSLACLPGWSVRVPLPPAWAWAKAEGPLVEEAERINTTRAHERKLENAVVDRHDFYDAKHSAQGC